MSYVILKRVFFAGMFTVSAYVGAQQKDSIGGMERTAIGTQGKVAPNSVPQNKLFENQVVDTIDSPDSPFKLFKTKESNFYDLKDHAVAAKFDSIWIREVIKSNALFGEMEEEITNIDTLAIPLFEFSTDTLKLRLEQLNRKTPFNVAYNPSLESVIKSFLTRRRGLMERMMTMSQFYFPLFEQEFDNHNIPLEMKYLAIIESALNPKARSRVGATGLWQFMYGTGREMGLEINSYVDERSDPIKSTKAASKYLNRLYSIYEDWDLALAAYNSGPGNVNKAIRRSGGHKNYWNLRSYLPRETAGYVPAFLATMYIFEYAEEYGITGKMPERNYFETDTVHVKSFITFNQISELTGIDKEVLTVLNPSYKLDAIPYVEGKVHILRLPWNAMGKFVANEEAIYAHVKNELASEESPLPELVKEAEENRLRYKVRSGDFLGKIAERYGVGVSQIKQWNGLRSNNLRIGQRLTIYPKRNATAAQSPSPSTTKTSSIASNTKVHEVKSGDSLWTISRKYPGISIENLRKWNGISGNNLKPGTKLKLCDCSS